jgi:hypothetical protein
LRATNDQTVRETALQSELQQGLRHGRVAFFYVGEGDDLQTLRLGDVT